MPELGVQCKCTIEICKATGIVELELADTALVVSEGMIAIQLDSTVKCFDGLLVVTVTATATSHLVKYISVGVVAFDGTMKRVDSFVVFTKFNENIAQ